MNEKLIRIAIEADAWCDQHYPDDECYNLRWEEKFAELIVAECIKAVEETPLGYKDYRNQIEEGMRAACSSTIKQKFEIE